MPVSLSASAVPARPSDFAERYRKGGWRAVERHYRVSDTTLLAWIDQAKGAA